MTFPFILFATGLICAGIATMTTYMIQKTLWDEKSKPEHEQEGSVWGYRLTWFFVIASTVCFAWGSIWSAMIIAG